MSVKWPGNTANHPSVSSAEVKNEAGYASTPPHDFRDNLINTTV